MLVIPVRGWLCAQGAAGEREEGSHQRDDVSAEECSGSPHQRTSQAISQRQGRSIYPILSTIHVI